MRLILYYFLMVIIVIVILPLIIVKGCGILFKEDDKKSEKDITIKVLFHNTGQIKEIALEEYIKGVVAAEMPASYHIEALKAQAVAARTYAYNKFYTRKKHSTNSDHPDADVCTESSHCQAWISREDALRNWSKLSGYSYWNKISQAVEETKGEIITYKNELIIPVFHANSGGKTENSENVWGGSPVPYLRGVESPGEESSPNYFSQAEFTSEQITEKLKKEFPDFQLDKKNISRSIKIKDYTQNQRVNTMMIGNKILNGTDVRRLLGLKSTNFSVEVMGDKIVFKVKGYGHGVGMSQCGANVLARKGFSYKEILKYYYKGVEIETINSQF